MRFLIHKILRKALNTLWKNQSVFFYAQNTKIENKGHMVSNLIYVNNEIKVKNKKWFFEKIKKTKKYKNTKNTRNSWYEYKKEKKAHKIKNKKTKK